jgi:hypothetical protein
MRSPLIRAATALLLFSSWLALLFSGFAFHGGVHLLPLAALIVFPWRAMGPSVFSGRRSRSDPP